MPSSQQKCSVAPAATNDKPLCVDLDGTLIRSDLLLESIFALLKKNIFYFFLLPLWLSRGKACFKHQIARRADLNVSLLPYHQPFIDYLKTQKNQGRTLVLATASNIKYARQVSAHLALFDAVMASDEENNLSGARKCRALLDVYGEQGFDYAGNAPVDIEIWQRSRRGIVVNPGAGVQAMAEKVVPVEQVFDDQIAGLKPYLQAIRLHQWLKNLLIFVPLMMAHKAFDPLLIAQAVAAFVAFGLCASSVYLLNDLFDLPADRQHPSKCKRALAAGRISIIHATLMIPLLLLGALAIALFLPIEFLLVLVLYYLTTLAYSLRLKQIVLVDVLVLASLYTIRIVAGAAAVSVTLSFWLLAFSMFLFLSLALVKRYSELLVTQKARGTAAVGRDYQVIDQETLAQFGIAAGYLAVLVLALYINSEQVRALYSWPEGIWFLCLLVLYWVSHVWLLARRDQMHEDPIVFAIEDRASHYLAAIALLILWLAA